MRVEIPRVVAAKLGYYVYVYVNPIEDSVFYVGKGKGSRALTHLEAADLTHLEAAERKRVTTIIRKIRDAGSEPRIDILAHDLPNEDVAFAIEAAAIDLIGIHNLTNAVRGHTKAKYGRNPLSHFIALYTKRKAAIREPSVLIRITKMYRFGMNDAELYDATRSAWRVGDRKDKAQYAFAVYNGVVREVYRITGWHDGGSTFAAQNQGKRVARVGRWEFVGTLAEDTVRQRYVNSYVGDLFPKGARNPVCYVNIDD